MAITKVTSSVLEAAQPNITSLGTLTGLTVSSTTATVNITGGNTGASLINFGDSDDGNVGRIYYDHTSNFMQFKINDAERMRIDSSGNVGIGCTPHFTFDVQLNSSRRIGFNYTDSQNTILSHDGSGNIESLGLRGNELLFYSDYDASNPDGVERMRIDSSGNLLVGTTTAAGKVHFSQSALDSDVLQLTNSNSTRSYGQRITFSTDHNNTTSQFLKFKGSTTDRLIIYSNGNIQNTNNSYGALSDEKLKENIVDATEKLEDLKQVRIRNYNFIGEDKKQIGVIAQELETIFPNMVEETPDLDNDNNDLGTTTKSVKYSVFVPMLVKAIQEQQTIIDNLTTRIETLENA